MTILDRSRTTYDAIIVGARAAGAATALLLARSGARVLAIDRGRYGSDTLSTHALMRGAVLQLTRWGVVSAIEAAGTPPIQVTTFRYGEEEIRIRIKARDGVRCLFAPRRYLLDRVLVDAAVVAGAEVRHGVSLKNLTRAEDGRVTGIVAQHEEDGGRLEARAGIVVGADGLHSLVARLTGADTYHRGERAGAVVYGYWPGLPNDGYIWGWTPGMAVGAIPTNDGETCLFVASSAARFAETFRGDLAGGYHRLLSLTVPDIASHVRALPPVKLRGFGGQAGFLRQSWGPGWALVGDAGYFKDPITAHGITDALRDAELLAHAVVANTPDAFRAYQQTRDDLSLRLLAISDAVASFEWDFETLKALHHELSDEMNREVDMMAADQRREPQMHTDTGRR